MEDIFIKILNMSITASYFVIALVIIRAVFRKIPKWLFCVMWGLVGLRLILPFSFESILSLIPSAETIPSDIALSKNPQISSGVPIFNNVINPVISESFTPDPSYSVNPLQVITFALSVLWLTGIAVMLIYTLISYVLLRTKTRESIRTEDGTYICDTIGTPFILGIIKPKIYIPSVVTEADRIHIIAHEKAHIKRLDHLWKPLGFMLLSVYWFNPLMWAAYVFLCRDIEAACDEKVLKNSGAQIKKSYSEALINCSAPKRLVTACPLAFGETGVKQRIKNVLSYKKPTLWIIITALIVSIIISACFMTNPRGTRINDIPEYEDIFKDVEKLQFKLPESYTYTTEDPKNELRVLKRIKIDPEAISDERNTERDSTYKIEINDKNTIYIDGSFSELWLDDRQTVNLNINLTGSSELNIDDGKLPSLTYKIQNPEILEKLFDEIYNPTEPVIGTETSPLFTEFEGVYLTLKSIDTNAGAHKVFNLIWNNTSDTDITYGEFYDIEIKNGDTWESVATEDIEFITIGYLLKAGSTANKEYSTQRFNISKIGIYRLITSFSIGDGNIYKTYIEFQIKNDGGDISDIGGVDGPAAVITTKKLTLDDVKELAKKGKALKAEDFAIYSSVDTSFGIYTREYKIDEMFYVEIGSERPDTEPYFFHLRCNDGSGLYADITTDDIEAFIESHKDAPIIKYVEYSYNTISVEYSYEINSYLAEIGGIPPKIAYSSVKALHAAKFTSAEELDIFVNKLSKVTKPANTSLSLKDYLPVYTEEHFRSYSLIIVYAQSDSSNNGFGVEHISVSSPSEGILSIGIRESVAVDEDKIKTGNLILITVPNEEINDVKNIDAVLSSTVYPQRQIYESAAIKTYVFKDSAQEIFKPNFTLYENGKFIFNFSPTSSYFGTGRYEKKDNTLILRTNDGKYVYTFRDVNDTMIFDAENSSETLHHADITDGSIFFR